MRAGPGQLTQYGERMVARMMYDKGRGFLLAAALLSKQGGNQYEYVALHLLCQGIEIVLKAILLLVDYRKYKPKLRKLGHDLPALVVGVSSAVGRKLPRPALLDELRVVSDFYKRHQLRYAGTLDMFIKPDTVPTRRVEFASLGLIAVIERRQLFALPT